ncbi:MAG: PSD1 and planctomycete cytochrome C domain-containing protein [Pirellulaceae bacterium]|nr:PSD1 and planctomycete cytochrome C domain-containing protein [Pirellulaceae bacterium]
MYDIPINRSALAVMLGLLVLTPASHGFALQAPSENEKLSAEQEEFFEVKIRPVLVKNCYGCHSQQTGKARGGLMLDTREAIRAGGDSGEGVVPGALDEGTIWSAINFDEWEMPPGKPLAKNEIADIRTWIEMGAPDPRVAKIGSIKTEITSADIAAAKESFWSFQSPKSSNPPDTGNDSWSASTIDRFIYAKLIENGLTPSGDADAETFLRRLCFDLIGLPPTPEQLDWFRNEWKKSPEKAIEYVTQRLLASEKFGERWGRHWLDVARYAESTGKELNAIFPHAWRYRDYVIDSFNQDKPYDDFIREQIAGDLLTVKSDDKWAENLVATGFLAIGPKTLIEQNPRQFLADVVDEQIDTSTRVILGMSVACARCHDHKFDPIPQSDYYAMAGIFLSTNTYFGTASLSRNRRPSALIELPVDDPDPGTRSLTVTEIAKLKTELQTARTGYETLLRNRRLAARGQLYIDGEKVEGNDPRISFAKIGQLSAQAAQLDRKIKSVDAKGRPATYCMGVQPNDSPVNARLLVRGELNQPAQEVSRGLIQVLEDSKVRISKDSSGRLELANWMADKSNPLTARVMVNRIWLHLFGEGIVSTPENFGATGQFPTHPELLDYLAVRFMESDWSVKTMVTEIVTSRAYRMQSSFDEPKFEIDPDNRFFWRANQQRLEAEAVRDSMLSIAGNLSLDRPRGSQASEISGQRQGLRPDAISWDESQTYRSVYLPVMRDNLPRVLAVFDFAEPSMVMGKRDSSNTPSQALYLLNNRFVIQQSEDLARRLIAESSSTEDQMQLAFKMVFGREATAAELANGKRFVRGFQSTSRYSRSKQVEALSAFCQALFASAEFRYVN